MTVSYQLHVDRKTKEIAFISCSIDFREGTILDVKEFIQETAQGIEKYKYAYNYRRGSHTIFRYDNASDPRARKLPSFPHHKHLSNGEMVASHSMTLSGVIAEIEQMQTQ